MKKFNILIITTLLIILLCSCNILPTKEHGSIKSLNLQSNTNTSNLKTFKKEDDPFGYQWTILKNSHGKFIVNIPSTWNTNILSNRCIKLSAPADDNYFPNTTFYILARYDINTIYDAKHFATDYNNDSYEYSTIFKDELLSLYFQTDKGLMHIRNYPGADTISSKLAFTKNKLDACLKSKSPVTLEGQTAGDVYASNYGYAACYVNWTDYPLLLTTVCPTQNLKKAEKILKVIASSLKEIKQYNPGYKTVAYKGLFSLQLPSDFKPETTSNILASDPYSLSSTSGMSFGIFSIQGDNEKGALTNETLNNYYGDILVAKLMNSKQSLYTAYSTFTQKDKNCNGKGARTSYVGTASYVLLNDTYDSLHTYANNGTYNLLLSEIYKNKHKYILICQYDKSQEKLAKRIFKKAITSFK